MNITTLRLTLVVVAMAAAPAAGWAAQSRPAPAAQAPAVVPSPASGALDENARDTRDRMRQILDQYPPSLGQVLRLDPSLLTRTDYLAPYPTLANFLAAHPR